MLRGPGELSFLVTVSHAGTQELAARQIRINWQCSWKAPALATVPGVALTIELTRQLPAAIRTDAYTDRKR